jgi:hypothetical protein
MKSNSSDDELKFTDDIRKVLNQTYKWVYFLSIIGFIGVMVLLTLGALFGYILRNIPVNPFENVGYNFSYYGLVFVWVGLICLIPVLDLYKFSIKLKRALKSNMNSELLSAFKSMNSHYKYISFYFIAIAVLYIIFSLTNLDQYI